MRLSLDALVVLDAIDRNGSFASAAEELYRVPSAITYTVQKLEQDLDIQVFDRSGHKAKLTEAGRLLLKEGRHLIRAANELESRAKRMATGWESELRIAVGDLLPMERIYPLLKEFYAEQRGTEIRLSREILTGCWDALVSGRADIAVMAAGNGPSGGGYGKQTLGNMRFVFVMAPDHPLAQVEGPLDEEMITCHRAVAAADSSRTLPTATTALLSGQEVLTMPDMACKLAAHIEGLGVGYVPYALAKDAIDSGQLVTREVNGQDYRPQLLLAWGNRDSGKAREWFLERFRDPELYQGLLDPS